MWPTRDNEPPAGLRFVIQENIHENTAWINAARITLLSAVDDMIGVVCALAAAGLQYF